MNMNMKWTRKIGVLAVTSALLGVTMASVQAQTVTNGGFEQPAIGGGSYALLLSIPGWTLAYGNSIELQSGIAGSPFQGAQLVELDSDASSGIYQDLATTPGQSYNLQFAFSARPGFTAADNILGVQWNGLSIATLVKDGTFLSNTNWQVYNYLVTATGSTTRLEFDDLGISNSWGTYVDAVSLQAATPEPASIMLILPGLAGLGLAFRRRKQLA